jgi:hypothetical protein
MFENHGESVLSTLDEKRPSFSLPKDDNDTFPPLVPSSDWSNSTGSFSSGNEADHHLLVSWRHNHHLNKTAPSRASSHAVTSARTKAPEPPLPIKAARAMKCVSSSHHKPPPPPPSKAEPNRDGRPQLTPKRSSLKKSDSSNEQKRVYFGNLEMRKYEIVLGDHPDCSSGPPVAIGWEYSPAETISVDQYEALKPRRRSMDQLELNYFVRKQMLRRNAGVSDEEMRQSIDDVHRIQKQRLRTKRMQPVYKLREAVIGR